MTIRYERRGLQVVRVVDATPPVPAPAIPSLILEDAAALIRTAAALRADANRRRAWGFRERETGNPDREVTGAQLRAARQAVGLSQRALAQQFPYGRGLLASVELGYRSCPPDLGAWAKHVLALVPEADAAEQGPA